MKSCFKKRSGIINKIKVGIESIWYSKIETKSKNMSAITLIKLNTIVFKMKVIILIWIKTLKSSGNFLRYS